MFRRRFDPELPSELRRVLDQPTESALIEDGWTVRDCRLVSAGDELRLTVRKADHDVEIRMRYKDFGGKPTETVSVLSDAAWWMTVAIEVFVCKYELGDIQTPVTLGIDGLIRDK